MFRVKQMFLIAKVGGIEGMFKKYIAYLQEQVLRMLISETDCIVMYLVVTYKDVGFGLVTGFICFTSSHNK
jgi:hypothetical protein